jgi:hypothetical protein
MIPTNSTTLSIICLERKKNSRKKGDNVRHVDQKVSEQRWNRSISMSFQKRILCSLLLTGMTVLIGCKEPGDRYEEKATLTRMRLAAGILKTMIENHYDDPFQYVSYSDALANWKSEQEIDRVEASMIETDWWGNEYEWELINGGNRKVVRLISAGRNGVRENGNNDDLWIELEILDTSIHLRVKPLDEIGRSQQKS